MRYVSPFIATVRASLLDLDSYGKRGETFWKGVRYLYILSVITSFIIALVSSVAIFGAIPKVNEFLDVSRVAITEAYPPELRLTIASGSMSTNVKTPYFVGIPPAYISYFELDSKTVPHLIAIDPDGSVDDFLSYQSLVLLTEKNIVTVDKASKESDSVEFSQNYRVMRYKVMSEPLEITKKKYDDVMAIVQSYFGYVKPVVIAFAILSVLVLPFIYGIFTVLASLILFLLTSLAFWLLSIILKRRYSYQKLFVLSLYALTASILFVTILGIFGFYIPHVYLIIFTIYMIAVIVRSPKTIQ